MSRTKHIIIRHPDTGKQVRRGRYLMEIALGRPLLPTEVVHHIDRNQQNDSLDNLKLMSVGEHSKLHNTEDEKYIVCKQALLKANLGRKFSEGTIAKMRAARLGKRISEATKIKLSQATLGTKRSEGTKQKMSAARKGQIWDKELNAFKKSPILIMAEQANVTYACMYQRLNKRRKAMLGGIA